MNVGQLVRLIQDLPEDTEVLIAGNFKSPNYKTIQVVGTIIFDLGRLTITAEKEEQQSLPPQ